MKVVTRSLALALVAALALPAVAAAHDKASTASVRQHARAADRAADRAASLVRAGRDNAAMASLARERRQLRAARREARRLVRSARRGGSVRSAALAQGAVGTVAGDCVGTLSAVVGQAGDPAQVDLAQAIQQCVAIRQAVIDMLNQLLTVVPEQARPVISRVIAMLSTDGIADVTAIGGAIQTPSLPPEAMNALQQALSLATQAINLATSQLAAIVPMLPPMAQPLVQQALGLVTAQLGQVTALLENLFNGFLGGTTPGTTPSPPGGGLNILDFLNSLLGGLFTR